MIHASLFSGIGGFDLAAEWMGWENTFHCENNEFGKKILKYYWPNAKSYEDITKTDFNIYKGRIDILTGGFPCQPYSTAGKRLGKEDDRHLWPEMLRAIQEIQPTWVVGENVFGLVNWNDGLVFNEVQVDLEAEGYEVQPFVLPAAGINAPHKRDRVWFIAYSNDNRASRISRENESKSKKKRIQKRDKIQHPNISDCLREFSAQPCCKRCNNRSNNREARQICNYKEWDTSKNQSKRNGRKCRSCKNGETRNVANTNKKRLQGQCKPEEYCKKRWKTENGSTKQYSCDDWRTLSEAPWENFPTQPPICNGDDGLSERLDTITFPKWRVESIKGLGNAIVPQLAFQIFKTIELYNQRHKS